MGVANRQCRLCNQFKVLRNSHLFPKSCLRFDDKGRLIVTRAVRDGTSTYTLKQDGFKEYLLCEGCEQILNRYEAPFNEFWKSKNGLGNTATAGQVMTFAVDYLKTKLLLLSILWRHAVSNVWGRRIRLGPYQERLRDICYNGEVLLPEEYPMFARVLVDDEGEVLHGMTIGPVRYKLDHISGYQLVFAGCEWTVLLSVSAHDLPGELRQMPKALATVGVLHADVISFRESRLAWECAKVLPRAEYRKRL